MINEDEVDWRERACEHCINTITTQSNVSEKAKEISDDEMMIMLKRRMITKKESVLLNLLQSLTKYKKVLFWMGRVK